VASHTPTAETMDTVLSALVERYGGAVGWLEAHGFRAEEQAALRSRLRGEPTRANFSKGAVA
jgi:protein-tyrosine phosphatase